MRDVLAKAIAELEQAGIETPRLDAEVLLAHALGCDRHELYTATNWSQAPAGSEKLFHKYIERRKKREPVAYITGYKEFWSLRIKVAPDVLIPRPETETLVEQALKILRMTHDARHMTLLDLCTGSGCIAAALAKELPKARFVVTDISEKALAVAKENLRFAQDRIQFIQSDLFASISEKFDLIVSNPPYVSSTDWEKLAPEIKNYEPRLALDGGLEGRSPDGRRPDGRSPDGLDFIRQIRQDAPRFLKPEGWLILENGPKVETWNVSSLKGATRSPAPSRSAALKIPFCL